MHYQAFWERVKFKAKEQLTSVKFWALVTALVSIAAGYSTGAVTPDKAVELTLSALLAYAGLKVTDDALTRRA